MSVHNVNVTTTPTNLSPSLLFIVDSVNLTGEGRKIEMWYLTLSSTNWKAGIQVLEYWQSFYSQPPLLPASHSPTQVYYKLTGSATTQLITEIPSTHIHTSTILQEEGDDDEHDDVCPGSVINGGVAWEDLPN